MRSARIYVYRNLNDQCWSLMCRGKVFAHGDTVMVTDARFKVRAAGRQEVLRTRRKNVHAFVTGVSVAGSWRDADHLAIAEMDRSGPPTQVRYDPYQFGHFFSYESGPFGGEEHPVYSASKVLLTGTGKVWAWL